jgi:hypothetical protein
MNRRGLTTLIAVGCLYLGILGFLAGMVVERMRFDPQRDAGLKSLPATERQLHTRLMDLERHAEPPQRGGDR